VFQAIYLKITGWNILRAAVCAKMRKLVHAQAQTAAFRVDAWVFTTSRRAQHAAHGWKVVVSVFFHLFSGFRGLPRAA
jgi:hypothetical protein